MENINNRTQEQWHKLVERMTDYHIEHVKELIQGRKEADASAGTAWRYLRRYKYRVRHLLADVQKAVDVMNQSHYGSNDTELDNYYDAKYILEKIIENKR